MDLEEQLIGFDAREMWCEFGSTWSAEQIDLFLLRRNIIKPLSVDVMIWPSVFMTADGLGFPDLDVRGAPRPGIDAQLPDWVGPNSPWWANLNQLRQCLAERWVVHRGPHWIIAVSRHIDPECDGDEIRPWPEVGTAVPVKRSPEWEFLGFDVADYSMLSGLSDCGYKENIRLKSRDRWGSYLNEYHLFTDLEHAITFVSFTDNRAIEHAPFYVYSLWKVDFIMK